MKKFIISFFFCLAMGIPALAQSALPELDKIRQIKLLESTREDVKRIFSEDKKDFKDVAEEDEVHLFDEILTKNMYIRVHYSLGNCADDYDEEWNVPKRSVTEINVILRKSVKTENLKIDLSKLERIKEDKDEETDGEEEEDPDNFVYYDKDKNVSYGLSDGKIQNIKFTPAEKNFPALCSNETVREYVSHKEWLLNKLRYRPYTESGRPTANVVELVLSKNELTADCPTVDLPKNESDKEYFKVAVATKGESSDPTDVLTYNYTVTGGKIVGAGANVTWDLSGVESGTYTITAGVDNGCGVCGTTKTETVTVKKCADCGEK